MGSARVPVTEKCRKCGGNMFSSEDIYSRYLSCLQCGQTHEPTRLGSLDEVLETVLRAQRVRLGLPDARP